MDREKAGQLCERILFGILLFILVFAPLAMGSVRGIALGVLQGATVLAGLCWLARLWIVSGKRLFWSPLSWVILAFLLYAVFQYFHSDVEFTARQELIKVTIYALLFFIISDVAQQQRFALVVCVTLVVLGTGLAGYAIFQAATGSQFVWHFIKPAAYASRAGGTFINPNHLAGFLGMILPIGLSLVLQGRMSHLAKIFIGYGCLMMVAGIFVTVSRGGWLATGGMLAVFCCFLLARRGMAIPTLIVLLVVGAIGFGLYKKSFRTQARVARTFDQSGKVEDLRFRLWNAAIGMWKESPWVGIGPGHFDYRYGQHRVGDWKSQGRPMNAHNDYLTTLAEWGALGVGLGVIALVLLGIGVVKSKRAIARAENDLARRKSNREAILFGAAMGVLMLVLHCVVEFNLQVPSNAILAITLVAIITSFRRYESSRTSYELSMFGRIALTGLILLALGFLTFQTVRKVNEDRWLRRAKHMEKSLPDKLAALKRAHAADPGNFETAYLIGETLRQESFRGNADYKALAQEAVQWFQRGMELNRYFILNYIRNGMSLDWLGQHDRALAFFEKAVQIEPNSYYPATYMGWHFMQVEDYENARKWFERSLKLNDNYKGRNQMPDTYLEMIRRREAEASQTNELVIPPKP